MGRTTPRLQDGLLQVADGHTVHTLPVGDPAWYAWLAEAMVFAFVSPHGSFAARQEAVGHGRAGHLLLPGRQILSYHGPRPRLLAVQHH